MTTQLLLRRLLIPNHPLHDHGGTPPEQVLYLLVLKRRPLLLLETVPWLLLLIEEQITCSTIVCIKRSFSHLEVWVIVGFSNIVIREIGIVVMRLNSRRTTITITLEKCADIQISTTCGGGGVSYSSELHLVWCCRRGVFIMNYCCSSSSMLSSRLMERAWVQSYHQLVIV